MRDAKRLAAFNKSEVEPLLVIYLKIGGVSKSMLKKSRLDFDKIEKCE